MKGIHIALFLGISLFYACAPNKQAESLCAQADSLMQVQPDSALRLLKTGFALQELSQKESARYALLLAQATDKCEKPLLPCDSLLDIALDYYDDDEKERAVALLYKGRLEIEMEQKTKAIEYFKEGLQILQSYPEETETRIKTLSSLGNEYLDARLFEEAHKSLLEMYRYCTTDKDISIALNSLGIYHYAVNEIDSAIVLHKKALSHAIASNDSMQIASSQQNLSIMYYTLDKTDSAIYYAQNAINQLSKKENRGAYYSHLGNLYLDCGKADSAYYYLSKALNENSLAGKANTLEDLADVEIEKGNYQTAITYLKELIVLTDSLYNIEGPLKIQKVIHEFDTQSKLKEEKVQEQLNRRHLITGFIIICSIIIIINEKRIHRRKEAELRYRYSMEEAQNKLTSLQTDITNNLEILRLMQQKQETTLKNIEEKELFIKQLQSEKEDLKNLIFSQSNIYKRILQLSQQKSVNKKTMKALTTSEQAEAKTIIQNIYADYSSYLKETYPKLTEDDIFCLCLQKTGLSSQAIAISLGYSDTHPFNQRKLRIKERMQKQ